MLQTTPGSAQVDNGGSFHKSSSGRWAGERFLAAIEAGREISAAELRTLDTLSKDDWINFDKNLVEAAVIRLRGVADLQAAGLTIPIPNSLGKTIHQYEKITDMNPAEVSLSGEARTEDDRQEFSLASVPLPITHKDFNLNLRHLMASREKREGLDVTQIRTCGRLIAEKIEDMLFNGHSHLFGGNSIYGYTTHPNRNTSGFGTNGNWAAAAKTGEDVLDDVFTMISAMEADRMWGPYWLYVPANSKMKLEEDFKANSDKTTRQRLLEVDRLEKIQTVDSLASNNIIMVQASLETTAMLTGEPLQTVQWDIEGGFKLCFKAFTIMVPLLRSDHAGRMGLVHMS